MATTTAAVNVTPVTTAVMELEEMEGGTKASQNADGKTTPAFCSSCVSIYQTDRNGLDDFYKHWPREFSGQRGIVKDWNLLVMRIALALASIGIFFWSIGINIDQGNDPWWFLFLTNWILLWTVLHYLVWCFVTWAAVKVPAADRDKASETWSMARIAMNFHSTGLVVNFIVTLLYWALLFPDEEEFHVMRVFTHGGTLLFMLIDTILAGHRMFLAHMPAPWLFGVVYIIFTVIYWAAGGTARYGEPIYSVLDWEFQPGPAAVLVLVVAFAALPLAVCGCVGLSCLWRNQCRTCAA